MIALIFARPTRFVVRPGASGMLDVPQERRVVLVGHSGAGPLLPAIHRAIAQPLAACLFVDASLPYPGKSALDDLAINAPDLAQELRRFLTDGGSYPTWGAEELREILPDTTFIRDFAMQLMVGQRSFLYWLSLPNQGRLVSPRTSEMPIEAVLRDVQFSAHKPLSKWFLPLKDALPFLLPNKQFRRLLTPERFRVLNRFMVHFLVLLKTRDVGFLRKGLSGIEDPVLDQV
jgi:hypothetical protein